MSLPVELVMYCLKLLRGESRSLSAVSWASRDLHRLVEPILYSNIKIQAVLPLRSRATSLGKYVTSLEVDIDEFIAPDELWWYDQDVLDELWCDLEGDKGCPTTSLSTLRC